ncbi:hypothetical protein DMC14_001300 [Metamycoplasma phocicerebrale]|uniref:Uncharacterized protein n=1 Tax=Metamycoplasma phocicerebrale TaxID=142649 RepID=A0A3T0TTL2_9BACT|nr:hypothetical protein [Metamycoplasma phocicerebrale]AZZ65425.1 hypothetical protein DMC14_001300 [Metamycoplasma phocicerebrale]
MENKDFSLLIAKTKQKRIAKRVLSIIGISLVAIVGLVMLAFIIYGLIVGVYNIFSQDVLRLFR